MNDIYIGILILAGPACVAGIIAGWMAKCRGLNVIGWGLLTALVPFFLVVVYFKKPDREIRGHYRKCAACGETYPWKLSACKYCGSTSDNGL